QPTRLPIEGGLGPVDDSVSLVVLAWESRQIVGTALAFCRSRREEALIGCMDRSGRAHKKLLSLLTSAPTSCFLKRGFEGRPVFSIRVPGFFLIRASLRRLLQITAFGDLDGELGEFSAAF